MAPSVENLPFLTLLRRLVLAESWNRPVWAGFPVRWHIRRKVCHPPSDRSFVRAEIHGRSVHGACVVISHGNFDNGTVLAEKSSAKKKQRRPPSDCRNSRLLIRWDQEKIERDSNLEIPS